MMTIIRQLLACFALTLVLNSSVHAQFFDDKKPQLLPESEAFEVLAAATPTGINVAWSIADDYYMYRDQFSVEIKTADSTISLPLSFSSKGVIEDDPDFGAVEVFFFNTSFNASFTQAFTPEAGQSYTVVLKGQGCNKPVGVCYPPMQREVSLSWSNVALTSASSDLPTTEVSTELTQERSFWGLVLSAFGAGLLLSLTPCVLPLIPILSGVIARQSNPSKLRSGFLACCYVAGTTIAYIAVGWVAGASGTQLQAYFQNVWVISAITLLLIALAASLFGAFKIQTPSALQTRVHGAEISSDGFLPLKSFGLGLISSLVVGACVSPILILALGTAISQGDPVLGAAIMGSMALGMGVLLIIFGFGAGWVIPRTGAWMQQVQALFGFMVLGVAIFIASSLSFVPVLLLWSLLLLVFGFYLWQMAAIDSATELPGLLTSIGKGLAAASIIWGGLALIGYAQGGRDIMSPLSEFSTSSSSKVELAFNTTTDLPTTVSLLEAAKSANKPVLIDFYADWCFDCVRMKRTTFREPSVVAALQNWQLIMIDVTENSEANQIVKQHFDVFGPPATLFFNSQGGEVESLRQYGYLNTEDFLSLVTKVD